VQQAQGFCVWRAEVQNQCSVIITNNSNNNKVKAFLSRPNAKPKNVGRNKKIKNTLLFLKK